jgi:hypothetical protein
MVIVLKERITGYLRTLWKISQTESPVAIATPEGYILGFGLTDEEK